MRAAWGFLIVPLLVCLPTGHAWSQWQDELAYQIEDETGCRIAFLSEVVERQVEGRLVVLAKVHCEDKRTFDVVRDDPLEPFELHQCEVPDVKTC